MGFEYDVCIVGGLGHVGLPLSIMFASKGLKVCAYDISEEAYKTVSAGKLPFMEFDADHMLARVLGDGTLRLSMEPESISKARNVIITIGTPIDEHLNPEPAVEKMIEKLYEYFVDGQLVILRSTVYPGTTERMARVLQRKGKKVDVAFCPERIVQGYGVKELQELPHIVSAVSPSGVERAKELFKHLNNDIVVLEPMEAELSKLYANAWRYVTFAAANQFFIIAEDAGLDFYKIYNAMTHNYPRFKGLPTAGFASGPCLFKDTVHLNAFSKHDFHMGSAALLVNEGLPSYIVDKLKKRHELKNKNVCILGMAFKANIDDKRDSLSYEILKILKYDAKEVYCTDPYVKDENLVSMDKAIKESDIIILGVPHKEYKALKFPKGKTVIDIWNFFGNGCLL